MNTKNLMIAVLGLLLTGCMGANIKPAQPAQADAAGIVARIPSPCLPLMPCGGLTMTFARVNGEGLLSTEVYQTSVERDGHYYLLNVPPGRYVAVASTYARGMSTQNRVGNATVSASRVFGENVLFPEDLVRATLVEVRPGRLAVMGALDYDIEGRMAFAPSAAQFISEADATQVHYARQLDPELETRGVTSAIKFFRAAEARVDNGENTRRAILAAAGKHIGADGWNAQIADATD